IGPQIVAIVGRLGSIELDVCGAGIERGSLLLLIEPRPGCSLRLAGEHRKRAPYMIDPWALRLASFDDDADPYARDRIRLTQLAASSCLTGRPVTRFCGFIRKTLSAVMARIRYTGSLPTLASTTAGLEKASRKSPTTRPREASSRFSPRHKRSPILVPSA